MALPSKVSISYVHRVQPRRPPHLSWLASPHHALSCRPAPQAKQPTTQPSTHPFPYPRAPLPPPSTPSSASSRRKSSATSSRPVPSARHQPPPTAPRPAALAKR